MLLRVLAGPLMVSALLIFPATAEEPPAQISLPQLAPCEESSHPRLPEKWRGAYLMAPFSKGQLVLAEIVSDASVSAMRVRLHGVRRGSVDLFVLSNTTYALSADG